MAEPAALTSLNVREQWQAAFPHLQPAYDQLAADEVFSENGIPGLYFLVEGLFAHYIELLLRLPISRGRDEALHAAFAFLDRLLTSPDDRVIGLGQIGKDGSPGGSSERSPSAARSSTSTPAELATWAGKRRPRLHHHCPFLP